MAAEVIIPKDQKSNGNVKANDGNGAKSDEITPQNKKPPAETKAKAGGSEAIAHVSGSVGGKTSIEMNGSALAKKAVGAPAKAEATATSDCKAEFELKQDGRKLTLKVDDHFKVTLQGDDARASIQIVATVKQSNTPVATLDKTYKFEPNQANPITKIDETGAHTKTIDNPGIDEYKEEATQVTLNKGDYSVELKLMIETSASVLAEAIVDKVELTFPER